MTLSSAEIPPVILDVLSKFVASSIYNSYTQHCKISEHRELLLCSIYPNYIHFVWVFVFLFCYIKDIAESKAKHWYSILCIKIKQISHKWTTSVCLSYIDLTTPHSSWSPDLLSLILYSDVSSCMHLLNLLLVVQEVCLWVLPKWKKRQEGGW